MYLGIAALRTNPANTQLIDSEDETNVLLVLAVIRAGVSTEEFFGLWGGLLDRGIDPVKVLREVLAESN
jgi:hypothetical protein